MMDKSTTIEFIDSEEGDWEEVVVNGVSFAANHRLYADDWIKLIKKLTGIKVTRTTIPSDD